MESDSWSDCFSTSKRHQSAVPTHSDLHMTFEEMDGEDYSRAEFPCPFCSEYFDIVGLCCHIDDEHSLEANNAVCPVCATRVGMDMVGHITMQHGHFFKMQRRRRFRKGSLTSQSTLSLLRKELREGNLQSLLGGSSYVVPSSNTTPDPLLSSFIYNFQVVDAPKIPEPQFSAEASLFEKSVDKKVMQSAEPSLSEKEHKEKSQKCEFIQGLLLSTFLDDTF